MLIVSFCQGKLPHYQPAAKIIFFATDLHGLPLIFVINNQDRKKWISRKGAKTQRREMALLCLLLTSYSFFIWFQVHQEFVAWHTQDIFYFKALFATVQQTGLCLRIIFFKST